jgi:hypothetical protein
MADIYNYERRLELVLEKIRKSDISEKNKEVIDRFKDECFAEGLSIARIIRHLYNLRRLAEWLKKLRASK